MLNPRTLFFQKQLLKKNVVLFVLSSRLVIPLCYFTSVFFEQPISSTEYLKIILLSARLGDVVSCPEQSSIYRKIDHFFRIDRTGHPAVCLCVHCIAQDFSPQFRLRLRCMTSFDSFYTPFWLSNKIYTNQSVEIPNRTL